MTCSLDSHLSSPGPKRILALDGGGVRGVISLAYLERLETILRGRFGPDTVLADYFDLIGGTSTGTIIATGLALGLPVARLISPGNGAPPVVLAALALNSVLDNCDFLR